MGGRSAYYPNQVYKLLRRKVHDQINQKLSIVDSYPFLEMKHPILEWNHLILKSQRNDKKSRRHRRETSPYSGSCIATGGAGQTNCQPTRSLLVCVWMDLHVTKSQEPYGCVWKQATQIPMGLSWLCTPCSGTPTCPRRTTSPQIFLSSASRHRLKDNLAIVRHGDAVIVCLRRMVRPTENVMFPKSSGSHQKKDQQKWDWVNKNGEITTIIGLVKGTN